MVINQTLRRLFCGYCGTPTRVRLCCYACLYAHKFVYVCVHGCIFESRNRAIGDLFQNISLERKKPDIF